MRLKRGTFVTPTTRNPITSFFSGTVNALMGGKLGKLWASENMRQVQQINTSTFGTSEINDIFEGPDLSVSTPNAQAYLAVSEGGQIRYSTDGLTWITRTSGVTNSLKVVSGGGIDRDQIWTSAPMPILSSNGLYINGSFNAAYGYSRYVVVGLYSTNGTNWISTYADMGNGANISYFQDIAYGGGVFMVASSQPSISTLNKFYYRSTNGISWTTHVVVFDGNGPVPTWPSGPMAYGQSKWVAVDLGILAQSTDNGLSFTSTFESSQAAIPIPQGVNDIVYGNGVWIASQYRSTNLITWTNLSDFYFPKFVNNAFFSNKNGVTLRSTDGINWTAVTNFPFNHITFANSRYWIVTNFGTGNKWVYSSTDGITWSPFNTYDVQTSAINLTNLLPFGTTSVISVGLPYQYSAWPSGVTNFKGNFVGGI